MDVRDRVLRGDIRRVERSSSTDERPLIGGMSNTPKTKRAAEEQRVRQFVRVIGALIERLGVQDIRLSYEELNRPREVGMAAEAGHLLITSFPVHEQDLLAQPGRAAGNNQ